jgi:hypothetical protein
MEDIIERGSGEHAAGLPGCTQRCATQKGFERSTGSLHRKQLESLGTFKLRRLFLDQLHHHTATRSDDRGAIQRCYYGLERETSRLSSCKCFDELDDCIQLAEPRWREHAMYKKWARLSLLFSNLVPFLWPAGSRARLVRGVLAVPLFARACWPVR